MFMSGGFSNAEVRWYIASKEIYPIVYAFERIRFMLRTQAGGIFVYTDHKAFLSIVKTKENEKRIYWNRLYRWILRLQAVDMVIFHIPSRDNFVTDLLTRWGKNQSLRISGCSMRFHEEGEFGGNKNDLYDYEEELEKTIPVDDEGSAWVAQDQKVGFYDGKHFTQEYEQATLKVRRLTTKGPEKNKKRQENLYFQDVLEASVNSTLEELREDIFKDHISFLSPFYPNGKRENINHKKTKKTPKEAVNRF
eukprot:augustus_masked-scaffold_3-processed-gene-6.66-mRNA-1 protein AED:1.00 eAED:1.00 QI:0/-1/0/0/-1/1/1/0/249